MGDSCDYLFSSSYLFSYCGEYITKFGPNFFNIIIILIFLGIITILFFSFQSKIYSNKKVIGTSLKKSCWPNKEKEKPYLQEDRKVGKPI